MTGEGNIVNSIVVGLGSMAYGKERRAVRTFKLLPHVRPYFLASKWEDGSVTHLLKENELEYGIAPFGYLGRAKPWWTLIALLHIPILCFKVVSAYLRRRCNVVVVISAGAFINALPAMLILKYLFRARVIFYLGDSPRPYWVNRIVGSLIKRTTRQIITNSQSVKRGWVQVGVPEEKIRVVYNGVDTERFEMAKAHDFRGSFGWPGDTLLIGFAGQFRPNKGAQDFVEAAELVLRENAGCRFVLIGKQEVDNDYLNGLVANLKAKQLETSVVFVGWVDEIESFFAGLDVVVVPSRHEDPAPNVAIEAMACGIPVVATRVGGTPEMVVDGETGLLVDKACPEQIAECLLRLAHDVNLRRSMGSAAKKRVIMNFDIRRTSTEIEEVMLGA